ncbi:4'-phosphopantetheinyl transferase superfamily protein [Winogradskyella maritima]|uniref:4'-phosphopantetheinyl transferase superfamily protein n=1 Tax=Winogradskyella maritima TaxID=1517766 RepID=A0ABV8AEB8_9FLAO|nr:4'-phosphopantetheinyl transferase superfamily protein [Winogradskyella maritima]
MIGNDIVDLKLAQSQSNWKRPRYLDKIFTRKEQGYITNSTEKEQMVWRLWSMKESAYKLYTQCYPSRFYNPKRFECYIEKQSGTVKFKDFECYVNSKITEDYVLSEASFEKKSMTSKVLQFENESVKTKSRILKAKVLKSVTQAHSIPKKQFEILKDNFGIPSIDLGTHKLNLSLSHHGRFGAYVIGNSVIPRQIETL